MREIKFRGISKKTREQVYGDYLCINFRHYIYSGGTVHKIISKELGISYFLSPNTGPFIPSPLAELVDGLKLIEIIPETLGQFTGVFYEKIEIYEGDIVEIKCPINNTKYGDIFYLDAAFMVNSEKDQDSNNNGTLWDESTYLLGIKGTIHDHLLKENIDKLEYRPTAFVDAPDAEPVVNIRGSSLKSSLHRPNV
jgi:hypothetical protein